MSSLVAPLTARLNEVRKPADGIEFEPNFKPLCPVTVNGFKVHALLDSGNLCSNAISENFAKQILGKKIKDKLEPISAIIRTCKRGKSGSISVLGRLKNSLILDFGQGLVFKIRPIVI